MKKLVAALLFAGFAGGVHADAIDDYINSEMTRQRLPRRRTHRGRAREQ